MKEVAYKPSTNVKPTQANINPTFTTPPYDDVGVSYKRYSKTRLSDKNWQLNPQETRFYTLVIKSGAFGTTLFPRLNLGKTFYCTKVILQGHQLTSHSVTLGKMFIADVNGTTATPRFYIYPNINDFNLVIDFSDCPRKFTGEQFDFYTQASLGATEFAVMSLFGWDE